jgi:hypothetical protein
VNGVVAGPRNPILVDTTARGPALTRIDGSVTAVWRA